jgi:hypothetical protein
MGNFMNWQLHLVINSDRISLWFCLLLCILGHRMWVPARICHHVIVPLWSIGAFIWHCFPVRCFFLSLSGLTSFIITNILKLYWQWADLWNSRFTLASSPQLQEVLAHRCIPGVHPARPCHHQHNILGGIQTSRKNNSLIRLTSRGLHFMVSCVIFRCGLFRSAILILMSVAGLLLLDIISLLVFKLLKPSGNFTYHQV